jgi:hypothetical protein
MNRITTPTFLAGVLLGIACVVVATPLKNFSEAQAQQLCLPRNQPCPAGYNAVQMQPGAYSPDPTCDHVCVPAGYQPGVAYPTGPAAPGTNTPLCQQIPSNPACR